MDTSTKDLQLPKAWPRCCQDGWRLVLAGGHFCNKAEQNYSPVEGEATAVAKGLEDTKFYTRQDSWRQISRR